MAQDFAPEKGLSREAIAARVSAILKAATLEEKVTMMSGQGMFKAFEEDGRVWGARPYRAGGGIERLGVPAFYFTDGPRGVARGQSTCFPCTMARGAAFDVDLERRIGEAMSVEIRAQGCNLTGAVCVNLLRHPAWGRAQETYGEDPHHLGELGAALAEGLQTHNVCATVKHYALNSMENARFKIDVEADPRALREVYLPHFKRILDAGCMSVMSAYNKVNGAYCGHHTELLTDILRHDWGFEGFVHSDWVRGVYSPSGATAGLDVENPEPIRWGKKLQAAVESGAIHESVIDQACTRILRTLYLFACAEDPLPDYPMSLVASDAHRALAKEAALKSAVLLKNDGALPLPAGMTIAVAGRLADKVNTGDNGSSRVRAPYVITPLQGLLRRFGEGAVRFVGDEQDPGAAAMAAKDADAAVVVVGYTAREEGEYIPGDITLGQEGAGNPDTAIGGDRDSLRLPLAQVALIEAVASANPRTIVAVIAGSAVLMGEWIGAAKGVLQTFYSGMEGGAALASLLAGDESPSGKLPFTVAADEKDYPFFDKNADRITYDLWHGYTKLEKAGVAPAFPFGYGLSYAAFSYRALRARKLGDAIEALVTVRNEGAVAADEIAQIYIGAPGALVERPKKLLKGFLRVRLAPGEAKTLRFSVPITDLQYWDETAKAWRLEPGAYRVFAGGDSQKADALSAAVRL